MANRRSVLIGLGGLVAGGGAILGTGAFTTVEAQRTVNVQTTGDASAFLGLSPADRDGSGNNEYVQQSGGDDDQTVEITLENPNGTGNNASGLNESAITVFRNLVTVTNNGTQDITSLELQFISEENDNLSASEIDDVFSFTVSPSGYGNNGSQSTIANDPDDDDTGADILGSGTYRDGSALTPGQSINFGIQIDLLDSGVTEIPADSSFTLQITAETANSN
ncbi:hypothetical protein [Halorubrum halodurans]|uniref:hypothetical protein n=1 Tax=Halorubrum halodurans TaxID=1383851 RepID=UPI00117B1900|nr:hypothetical protein [Halorubrum halodurans]